MGGLSTLGRSTLGGSIRNLADNQRAIRAGKKQEAIRVETQKRLTEQDARAERQVKIAEGAQAIKQKEADAKYAKAYDPQPLTMLTGAVRHPKGKQLVEETAKPYLVGAGTINNANAKQWKEANEDSFPQAVVGYWRDTKSELQWALDNFASSEEKNKVKKILESNAWVLKRPLTKYTDVEEALQSTSDELLRKDAVVEKMAVARRAAEEKAVAVKQQKEAEKKEAEEKENQKLTKGTPYTAEDGTRRVPWYNPKGEKVGEINLGKTKEKKSVYDLEPDEIKIQAKSVATGRRAPKTISARRERGQILTAVGREYPNYDFSKSDANYNYMNNSAVIRSAGMVQAAMPRVYDLHKKSLGLQNLTGVPILDQPLNKIKRLVGNEAVVDFESLRNAILLEVNAALSGTSVASDYRIKLELENLGSGMTVGQQTKSIDNLISALEARADAAQMILYPWDVVRGERTHKQWKADQKSEAMNTRNMIFGNPKKVVERRKTPDGRVLVKYSDGTIGEE